MFDLIKILVEKVIGQISYDAISKRRKEEKLANIGVEMLLLYMRLNCVIVVGEEILYVLKEMAQSQSDIRNYLGQNLKKLLRDQAEQLLKVITSCSRLSWEIGVVDESGGRVLYELLDRKVGLLHNQIGELWPELGNRDRGTNFLLTGEELPFLRSFTKVALDQALSSSDYRFRAESSQAWNSGVKIPLDDQSHSTLARKFLDSGAEENLKAITAYAQQLRQDIAKHFSIEDILLKVHDPSEIRDDPSRALWKAFFRR